jgi:hypothetical protein
MPTLADISSLQDNHVDLPPAMVERNIPPEIILQLTLVTTPTCVQKHNLLSKPVLYKQSNLLPKLQNRFTYGEGHKIYLTSLFMMEAYHYYMKNWSSAFTDAFTLACHCSYTSMCLHIVL